MGYTRRCPACGAYLDPCERCDCQDKETTLGAANAEGCKAESELPRPHSSSILHESKEGCQA